jgi:photosystem II stability/assembly factor-like uncharacterized protein
LFQIKGGAGFQQLAFPTRETGFAAGPAGVHRTDDGGTTWAPASNQPFGNIHFLTFADRDHGWLGSNKLYQTADGAKSWAAVLLPGADMTAVRALALGPDGWGLTGGTTASGELALFLRRPAVDDWERLDPKVWDGAERPHRNWFLGGLAVAGPKDGWAAVFSAGDAGVVLHTADGGDTWERAWSADTDLYHIHFADARRGWLAGLGKLWTTGDGGRQWATQPNPAGDIAPTCFAFGRGDEPFGLAPLVDGRVLWTNDGRTWQVVPPAKFEFPERNAAAAVVDPGRAYVLGRDGWVARYTDPRFRQP